MSGVREGVILINVNKQLRVPDSCNDDEINGWFGLVIALRPQTPKNTRGGWSHYTDTSEPVDGGVL
jgi:hypothetical protein